MDRQTVHPHMQPTSFHTVTLVMAWFASLSFSSSPFLILNLLVAFLFFFGALILTPLVLLPHRCLCCRPATAVQPLPLIRFLSYDGDDGHLMSGGSRVPPVFCLSSNALQRTIPTGNNGQLMSDGSGAPLILWLTTTAGVAQSQGGFGKLVRRQLVWEFAAARSSRASRLRLYARSAVLRL